MITIKNLEFSYPKHQVFKDVNLELEEGKIYGLLGQNGVGKTTLLKILTGLLKNGSGECLVNGANPFGRKPSFLQDIYFLPETIEAPEISGLRFAKSIGAFYPNFSIEEFNNYMMLFELDPQAKLNKLSHGQQKKAFIAVALSLNTKLLLLDEPSNGLDIPSKAQLRKVIAASTDETRTVIISTHQVRDLENLIDPIIILDTQGVLMNASIEEISEKLYFSIEPELHESALYNERGLGGYLQVRPNFEGVESRVNLEALFNTVLINKDYIKANFTK